MEHLGMQLQLR